MDKCVEAFKTQISKIRTGVLLPACWMALSWNITARRRRASAGKRNGRRFPYSENQRVYRSMSPAVEKAIMASDLGLNRTLRVATSVFRCRR